MRSVRRTTAAFLAVLLSTTGAAAQQRHRHTAMPQATTVILVRHAEKQTGNILDQDPDLTPAGYRRAADLYRVLKGRHVDAIITTQLKRTRETAQPTADSLHLVPVQVHMGRHPQETADSIARLIRTRYVGKTVLVVGHTTSVNRTIAALAGPQLGDLCDSTFGNLFTLVIPVNGTPRLEHTHYGAADPSDPECENGIHVEHHDHH
jgi:phosphohistidine phosphatase SixA